MAIDKDPSIYRDRVSIGSSDELDEYGVWVKSEPQELPETEPSAEEAALDTMPDIDFESPSEPAVDESFDESFEESPEEALGSFTDESFAESEASTEITESVSDESDESDESIEPALPDIEDLPDLNLDILEDTSETPVSESMDEVPSISSFDDVAIEEYGAQTASTSSFEELGALDTDADSTVPVSQEDFTELSMDDFLDESSENSTGVQENIPQEDEALNIDIDFNENVDLESDMGETEVSFDNVEESADTSDIKMESVSDFDDFLNDLSEEKEEASEESQESEQGDFDMELPLPSDGEDFDDVEALHRDLEESTREVMEEAVEEPVSNKGAGVDLSTQLLMRIAEELSSIKIELSSLKNELAGLKSEPKAPDTQETVQRDEKKGFFDEEEDEKIALTGDELDNILNTADFTEEAGSDAVGSEEEDSFLSDQADIISTDDISPQDSAAVEEQEEITVDDILVESTAAAEAIPEEEPVAEDDLPEELQKLREDGLTPMTEAPEDTSYLEADSIDVESIDLSEAVIEEPDLSSLVLDEAPLEEPSLDSIQIDLDMEEALQDEVSREEELQIEETPEEESIEIPTPMEASFTDEEEAPVGEESFEEVIPEGFVISPEVSEVGPHEDLEVSEIDLEEVESPPALEEAEVETELETMEDENLPSNLKDEVKTVLSYMDQLLESLPEEKIEEFARSKHFETYKKLFEELGLA